MELYQLKPKHKRKDEKRIGRGGKRGTYSGSGEKGQRKRSGHRIRPASRDLVMRIPKLRGVKNLRKSAPARVIAVGDLEKLFSGPTIDRAALVKAHIIRNIADTVKVLSQGEVKRAFEVRGIPASAKAKAKIEKAGGKVL